MKTLLALALLASVVPALPAAVPAMKSLERSYWLHASLARDTRLNYWGTSFPTASPPTEREVKNAARLLYGEYGASRLYLIYHREIPDADARRVFRWWRKACPKDVEVVPTFVLTMYDADGTPVFTPAEMDALCRFLISDLGIRHAAVYDVYPKRDQGEALAVLERHFPARLVRVGLQPGEDLPGAYVSAVQDTWSGLCHGRTTEDWQSPGFGAETLRGWVKERNEGDRKIDWDLVAVAWDYLPTKRGEFPGYDDAEKNMPLPSDRNRLAARLIRETARPEVLAGFSSDLFILHVNSMSKPHDGPEGSFYDTLKQGKRYKGYYSAPLDEIATIYGELKKNGKIR